MVRAVIVDDQAEVRSALKLLLEESAGINSVSPAANLDDLLRVIRDVPPNLILLDWDLAGDEPVRLINLLRKLDMDFSLIALDSCPQNLHPALDAGADYFVCKSDPPETLLAVINCICSRVCRKQGGTNV